MVVNKKKINRKLVIIVIKAAKPASITDGLLAKLYFITKDSWFGRDFGRIGSENTDTGANHRFLEIIISNCLCIQCSGQTKLYTNYIMGNQTLFTHRKRFTSRIILQPI